MDKDKKPLWLKLWSLFWIVVAITLITIAISRAIDSKSQLEQMDNHYKESSHVIIEDGNNRTNEIPEEFRPKVKED